MAIGVALWNSIAKRREKGFVADERGPKFIGVGYVQPPMRLGRGGPTVLDIVDQFVKGANSRFRFLLVPLDELRKHVDEFKLIAIDDLLNQARQEQECFVAPKFHQNAMETGEREHEIDIAPLFEQIVEMVSFLSKPLCGC